MRTRKTPASNDADRKSGYLHRSENCIALVESPFRGGAKFTPSPRGKYELHGDELTCELSPPLPPTVTNLTQGASRLRSESSSFSLAAVSSSLGKRRESQWYTPSSHSATFEEDLSEKAN